MQEKTTQNIYILDSYTTKSCLKQSVSSVGGLINKYHWFPMNFTITKQWFWSLEVCKNEGLIRKTKYSYATKICLN